MNVFLKKVINFLLFAILCVGMTGCASLLPVAAPPPSIYDIGLPKELSAQPNAEAFSNRDVIVIPEVQVDGIENGLGIVYRYTNVIDYEPKHYRSARWSQHPAEMLRFRMLQHLGQKYPVVLSADFVSSNSWMLRFTIEEFAHHIKSDEVSSGVVQIRVTFGQGGRFVGQKTFRAEVEASTVNVQGGVEAIARATDDVLRQIADWADTHVKAQYTNFGNE
ncbi:MAG: ABC-type transport auxiliary lipoprotein family protein [Saezia sp.]